MIQVVDAAVSPLVSGIALDVQQKGLKTSDNLYKFGFFSEDAPE